MEKAIVDRIIEAEAKVERAKIRHAKAFQRYYALLGWGEFERLERARRSVASAAKYLESAEKHLKRLQYLKTE